MFALVLPHSFEKSERALLAYSSDADGAIQNPHKDWEKLLGELCGDPGNKEQFLEDIFQADESYLDGDPGFPTALAKVLENWNSDANLDELPI